VILGIGGESGEALDHATLHEALGLDVVERCRRLREAAAGAESKHQDPAITLLHYGPLFSAVFLDPVVEESRGREA